MFKSERRLAMSKYETPDYEVILTEDDIEIRQYNE